MKIKALVEANAYREEAAKLGIGYQTLMQIKLKEGLDHSFEKRLAKIEKRGDFGGPRFGIYWSDGRLCGGLLRRLDRQCLDALYGFLAVAAAASGFDRDLGRVS